MFEFNSAEIYELSSYPLLTPDVVRKYFYRWNMEILVFNSCLTPKLIEEFIRAKRIDLKCLSSHPNLTARLIIKYCLLSDNPYEWSLFNISQHPKLKLPILKRLFKSNVRLDKVGLSMNPNLTLQFVLNHYFENNKVRWDLTKLDYSRLLDKEQLKYYFIDTTLGWKLFDKNYIDWKGLLTLEMFEKHWDVNKLNKFDLNVLLKNNLYTSQFAEQYKYIIPLQGSIWSRIILTEEFIEQHWELFIQRKQYIKSQFNIQYVVLTTDMIDNFVARNNIFKCYNSKLDLRELSKNPTLSYNMIKKYVDCSNDWDLGAILNNPNMTSDLLEKLIQDHDSNCNMLFCSYSRYKEEISKSHLLTSDIVNRYLKERHFDLWDFSSLSSNNKIEGWLIAKYWTRGIWHRSQLLKNPNTPIKIRKRCEKDQFTINIDWNEIVQDDYIEHTYNSIFVDVNEFKKYHYKNYISEQTEINKFKFKDVLDSIYLCPHKRQGQFKHHYHRGYGFKLLSKSMSSYCN